VVLKSAGTTGGYVYRRPFIDNSIYGDKLLLENKSSYSFCHGVGNDCNYNLWSYGGMGFGVSAAGCLGENRVETALDNAGGCRRSAGGIDCGRDILGIRDNRERILKKITLQQINGA
jgi:hypothetical protein